MGEKLPYGLTVTPCAGESDEWEKKIARRKETTFTIGNIPYRFAFVDILWMSL